MVPGHVDIGLDQPTRYESAGESAGASRILCPRLLLERFYIRLVARDRGEGPEAWSESATVVLARQAAAVVSITERRYTTDYDLAADDYALWPGGTVIERILGGTNSRSRFWGRVTVIYTPVDDVDIRKSVQADLLKLMESFQPGITAETVGSWTRQLASNSVWNNTQEREAILARLFVAGRITT